MFDNYFVYSWLVAFNGIPNPKTEVIIIDIVLSRQHSPLAYCALNPEYHRLVHHNIIIGHAAWPHAAPATDGTFTGMPYVALKT